MVAYDESRWRKVGARKTQKDTAKITAERFSGVLCRAIIAGDATRCDAMRRVKFPGHCWNLVPATGRETLFASGGIERTETGCTRDVRIADRRTRDSVTIVGNVSCPFPVRLNRKIRSDAWWFSRNRRTCNYSRRGSLLDRWLFRSAITATARYKFSNAIMATLCA